MKKEDSTSRFYVSSDDAGCRFDRWLRRRLALKKLSEIYQLIRIGKARVNGTKRKEGYRVQQGDCIEVALPRAEFHDDRNAAAPDAAALADTSFFGRNFHLIYEDENLLVCDKPVGLVVHSGTGHARRDSLVDCATAYLQKRSRPGTKAHAPFLVHRLDKDTSGVILFAKNRTVLHELHESFRTRSMRKAYAALCHGRPPKATATIETAIAKNFSRADGTKMKVANTGKRSVSAYRLERSGRGVSQLEIELHTGRTHQIRVHMAHISCPIIGDKRYGDPSRDGKLFRRCPAQLRRLYLHARSITFFYSSADREITFEAPLPACFSQLWDLL
jgi:RluA family pseudouridine synthase